MATCADGGECDPAHGPAFGMSMKGPDAEAIPLCRDHHRYQHKVGWAEFEKTYQFSRPEVAAAWWKAFKDKSAVPW